MTGHASDGGDSPGTERPNERDADDGTDAGLGTVESYESEGKFVLYDAQNPLAWVEANRSNALTLREYN